MKEVHLIAVGKLKDIHLETLEDEYLKRIRDPKLTIHEVKATAENKEQEALDVIKKVKEISPSGAYLVTLMEKGLEFDSKNFSQWLFQVFEEHQKPIIFVLGGAEGHGKAVLEAMNAKFSLSKLTFPHKLARILFVEQFYRAQTIKKGHPYHN